MAEICKQNSGQIIPLVPYKQILQETRENDHWETNIKDQITQIAFFVFQFLEEALRQKVDITISEKKKRRLL